jgi:hypothetical protein
MNPRKHCTDAPGMPIGRSEETFIRYGASKSLLVTVDFGNKEWRDRMRTIFQECDLGFVAVDMHGGFGDIPPDWMSVGALVLRRGTRNPMPEEVFESAEAQWSHHFRDYANHPLTPPREKTQAFERSQRESIRVQRAIV